MAVLAHTPLRSKAPLVKQGRTPAKRHTQIYMKTVMIPLAGEDPSHLVEVAAAAHQAVANHPLVLGGKGKRKVYASQVQGQLPVKVFDGTVRPEKI